MIKNRVDAHRGFTPASVVPQMRQIPNREYVIIAQSRGGMRGQVPFPPSSYPCFVFHSITKTFLQSLRRDKEATRCC